MHDSAGCHEAGIASGTVYLPFESEEALFQELLPALSENRFALIAEAVRGARDVLDLEDRGLPTLRTCRIIPIFAGD